MTLKEITETITERIEVRGSNGGYTVRFSAGLVLFALAATMVLSLWNSWELRKNTAAINSMTVDIAQIRAQQTEVAREVGATVVVNPKETK